MYKWIPVLIALMAVVSFAQWPQNLLPGSDFESADATGWSAEWFRVPGSDITRSDDGANHFARLHVAKPGTTSLMQHETALPADWKAVKLTARVRYDNVVVGKKGWNDARVQIIFLDANRKAVGKPAVMNWTGTLKDWKPQSLTAVVPPGATKVKVQVALFDAASGTLDIDDLQLVQGDSAEAPAEVAAPAPTVARPTTQPLPYKALEADFKGAKIEAKHVAGWAILNGEPEVVQDKDEAYLHMVASDDAKTVQIRRLVPLNADWAKLTLTAHLRYKNVKHGEKNWQNARLIVEFLDEKGQRIGTPPEAMDWKGSSKAGWVDETHDYEIPFGAASMKLDPALMQVASGTLDLAAVTVTITQGRSDTAAKGDLLPEAWKPALTPHWRDSTATRESVCLNGVWQIRPIGLAPGDPKQVTAGMIQTPPLPAPMPAGLDWGYGKVPSTFPGSKENAHDWALPAGWSGVNWATTDAAWFRRSIDIPANWAGRRIVLDIDTLQSQAAVFVGDKLVGRAAYPAGVIDLTDAVAPGAAAQLTILVIAKPLEESKVHAMNPNEVYLEAADLKQRGLCGDVFLRSEPRGPRLASVAYLPSVRKQTLTIRAATTDIAAGQSAKLHVVAQYNGVTEKEWTSNAIAIDKDGTLSADMPWLAQRLWDIDDPQLYQITCDLLDAGGKVSDQTRTRIGYREMWLDGRDIMLNGNPLHWRATKIGNVFGTRGKSQMAATFKRARELGFNCMILDYDIAPGSAPSYTPMFEAADEAGVVMIATLPSVIPWKGDPPTPEAKLAWQHLTDYCIGQAMNHPCVLAYATNHNRLGYPGSLNPEKIDGLHEPVSPDPVFADHRKLADESEAYIRAKDPSREVYEHSGGNYGPWETANCYLNWMPFQERKDYLTHWATAGVKPLFLTEWGMPFVASWGRYRGPGVYRTTADSEPLFMEYAAAVTGTRAYESNDVQDKYVDNYESAYAKNGKSSWGTLTSPWARFSTEWDYVEIQAQLAREVLPSMRAWGLSAIVPWDFKSVATWTAKTPPKVILTEPAEQWTEPGIHPDFAAGSGYGVDETWFNSPAADTFKLTVLADAYKKVNRDVLAFIAGRPEEFTEQSHLFSPGEKVVKQVIVINDLRKPLKASYAADVKIGGAAVAHLTGKVSVAPGRQQRTPIEFAIPAGAKGDGTIELTVTLPAGEPATDSFAFSVLPPTAPIAAATTTVLWDPKGDSAQSLEQAGEKISRVDSPVIADNVRCLIVGREALTVDGPAPDLRPLLSRGGRVIVLEQTEAVLSQRLGFRTSVPSMRNVFARVPGHPLLAGLTDASLRDWNGAATLIGDKLTGLSAFEAKYPAVDWLGFHNNRVWKVSNRGQVASVVIEKPQTGDFLSLIDGGFDLQYSPLLLSQCGKGEILFCQMDVSGRTLADPAAQRLLANLVKWGGESSADVPAQAAYLGDAPTHDLLASLGATLTPGDLSRPSQAAVTVIGPGVSAADLDAIVAAMQKSAGTCVVLFQSADALKAFGPQLTVTPIKLLSDHLAPAEENWPAALGVGPAELHLRARTLVQGVLPAAGQHTTSGALAEIKLGQARVIFLQIDPRTFDSKDPAHVYVKLTHNRTLTLLSRVLANAGVAMNCPLANDWSTASKKDAPARWLASYYQDTPQATDDPYRYYRW